MLLRRRDALVIAAGGVAAVALPGRVYATPLAPGMRFVSVGDWGRQGHDEQRAVGVAMGRAAEIHRSTWTLSLGDNFYEDGVQGTDDPQWRSSFEDIYDAPSLRSPWRVILGNHDYRGDVQAQLDYGSRDTRWSMPARYYARTEHLADGTPCDLFFIDTNPFLSRYRHSKVRVDGQDPAAQLAWLERSLAASRAPWKIVIGHHPIHTADGAPTEEPELIASLKPVLERHGVRVYLNGHIHNLQHIRVGSVDYVTNGGGSKLIHLYPVRPGAWGAETHGFMTATLTPDTFAFEFKGASGEPLYSASVSRTA